MVCGVVCADNFFIGVCTDGAKLTNYLGSDDHGFGYYGGGNSYRRGNSSSYGQSVKSGDTISVHLDMDARTLAFSRNGTDLGVAFRDLPAGGVVYPAFSLYSRGDHFTLTSFGPPKPSPFPNSANLNAANALFNAFQNFQGFK